MGKHKSKKHNHINIEEKFSLELCKAEPKNMSCTFNRNPYIYVDFGKNRTEVDLYSVRMFIDDKIVSSEVNSSGVGYNPRKELDFGKHKIEVTFRLKNEEDEKIKWFFMIQKRDAKYKFYFGVPHCHTSYSSGSGLPVDAYNHARKKGVNYLVITDHSRRLKGNGVISNKKYLRSICDFDRWEATKYDASLINKKYNKFLAITGFELSTSFWGHLNIYNTKDYIEGKIKNIDMFYEWLENRQYPIVSINHPNQRTGKIKYSPKLDQFVNLIEVGNGAPPYKYVRSEEIYFKLLDEGWHLGAINSQDNHKDDWGEKDNLTVVITEKLNQESFLDALMNRRTYSSETRSLKLVVKVNGHWMGSILNINNGKDINFEIRAEDKKNPIKKIQIISNGGVVIKEREFKKEKKIKWNYTETVKEENSWYVVKVIHSNDKYAIASAIFL